MKLIQNFARAALEIIISAFIVSLIRYFLHLNELVGFIVLIIVLTIVMLTPWYIKKQFYKKSK